MFHQLDINITDTETRFEKAFLMLNQLTTIPGVTCDAPYSDGVISGGEEGVKLDVYFFGAKRICFHYFHSGIERCNIEIYNQAGTAVLTSKYWGEKTGVVVPYTIRLSIISNPYMFLLKIDTSGANSELKSLVGTWTKTNGGSFIFITDTDTVFVDDMSNYVLDKVFYNYKTTNEDYILIPARIRDTSTNKYLAIYPLGVYGCMAFPTANSFYTFADGTQGYYKSTNFMYK